MESLSNSSVKNKRDMVQQIENERQNRNINLQLDVEEEGLLEITLFDTSGDLVYNYSDFVKGGKINHKVNCTRLQSRQYILRVAKNGKSEVKKLLVH